MNKPHTNIKKTISFTIKTTVLICALSVALLYTYAYYLHNLRADSLTTLETERLNFLSKSKYNSDGLHPLEWDESITPSSEPFINAKSAILIDLDSGSILYEKDPDQIIPPASMTKVAAMYVVFEEIDSGRITLDDIVPLPPEAWAINAPPDSSLMFLAQGHKVTLQEVLLGLNISSGNDAAVAVANYVSGSMEAFLARMNEVVLEAGLKNTFFVDSSGYSALNTTTAREFAEFARLYVLKYPETLELFHAVPQIAYPQEHNLPESRIGKDFPIVQKNTNPALGIIDGVTGLKTGFIDESGYNLALTTERNGTRFLSVTMGGPGRNSREGNAYRLEDSYSITEYAYRNFKSAGYEDPLILNIPVLGGKESVLHAKQAWNAPVTVPASAQSLSLSIELPASITSPVQQAQLLGYTVYSIDGVIIQRIPIIADRDIESSSLSNSYIENLLSIILSGFKKQEGKTNSFALLLK